MKYWDDAKENGDYYIIKGYIGVILGVVLLCSRNAGANGGLSALGTNLSIAACSGSF